MIRTLLTTLRAALIWVLVLPIAIYRRMLSPMKGAPSCRFLPTCSEYAATALRERGIVVGGALAVWRVLRCNPLFRAGYDPVPRARCAHCEDKA